MYEEKFGNNIILAMNQRLSELKADSDKDLQDTLALPGAAEIERPELIRSILVHEFGVSPSFCSDFCKLVHGNPTQQLRNAVDLYEESLRKILAEGTADDYPIEFAQYLPDNPAHENTDEDGMALVVRGVTMGKKDIYLYMVGDMSQPYVALSRPTPSYYNTVQHAVRDLVLEVVGHHTRKQLSVVCG